MASPYHQLKYNTRRNDDQVLRLIKAASEAGHWFNHGRRPRRWYDEARKPKAVGRPERARRAYGVIKMLRRLFSFGEARGVGGLRQAGIHH